jgi:hypothetical protein
MVENLSKKPEKSMFLELVGDNPIMRVIDFLIENKDTDFSKTDIAKGAGISRTSLFYCWFAIEKASILKKTRKFGKTTLYKLDTKSPVVKKMLELEYILVSKFLDTEAEKRIAKQIVIIKK